LQPLNVGPLPAAASAPVPPIAQTLSKAASDLAGSVRRVFALPPSAAPYADAIRAAEAKHGLPESLLGRVLWQESRFRPDIIEGRTKSPAGAIGIAQFMPATAKDVGIDPLDPWQSIDGAARYLRSRFDALGAWDRALAAYNWGIGNVQRQGMAKMPAETQAYVRDILRDVQV
jgi:soluble lytic murein transglycosylase-like protein